MPTSNAHDDAARARRAAAAEVRRAPVAGDPALRELRKASVGDAALVRSPDGDPAFWLVPFESGDRACGFARVELNGRVAQVSAFGAGAADRASWPAAEFFRRPPARALEEVRAKHLRLTLGEPVLSYDGTPAKWAWRIPVGGPAGFDVYVTPGGWYEKPISRDGARDREG
jgi:hypothetical protein